MIEDFESCSFDDFKRIFLLEKDLDHTPQMNMGELSKILSKTNLEIAQKLNSWAAHISSRVSRYIRKLEKRPDTAKIHMRTVPVGDGKTEAAAIIIINIENVGEIEISIFDNNKVAIKMSDYIAELINKGHNRKFMSNKDRVADYLVAILEKVAYVL